MPSQITTASADPLDLLAWYDRHHRTMPWRVGPGDRAAGISPDPYRVWLSEVMLQQTTVAAVQSYFRKFIEIWPTVHDLAAADREDLLAAWAGLGYYARARNLHACANVVSDELGGAFPDTVDGLRALPGIGPYTAAAIAAIAFDRPAVVVDGNVERVMSRIFAIEEPLPDSKVSLKALAADLTPSERPGDYAQAVMDLGATICTPRKPACAICPWMEACAARKLGMAEQLPTKRKQAAKPVRRGKVWIGLDNIGRVLTVQRPDKGLLGGMRALPTTDWDSHSDAPSGEPPLPGNWKEVGEVRHTFTHFHLILAVERADGISATDGEWMTVTDARGAMPTVFAKALRLL